MTDYDEISDDSDESPAIQQLRKESRELKKQLKEKEEAAAKTELLERKLAFIDAGIPNNTRTSYFVKGYDGELTTEAIQAAAREAELLPQAEPEVPQSEMDQHRQLANAGAGAGNADIDWQQRLVETGGKPEEVMKILQQAGVPTTWDAQ